MPSLKKECVCGGVIASRRGYVDVVKFIGGGGVGIMSTLCKFIRD